MSDFSAFVFDFDGVLADSVEIKTRAFEALYLEHGPDIAAEVVRYHREHGGMPRREKFIHYQENLLGEPADAATLQSLSDRFSKLVVDGVVTAPEIPGAEFLLEQCHGRLPLFVDSASPDKELREIIRRRGLDHLITAAYGSDRTKMENLAAILRENRLDPATVIFFGDALSDYKAAMACGTQFIGIVRTPDSPLKDLAETCPLFATHHDIYDYLEEKLP